MTTPGNSLNIKEVGFQSFDGISVFRGRTLTAGAGITISNGTGVSGNPTFTASGSVPLNFNGNTGTATPASNILNVVTANSTPIFAGAGSTLTQDFGITNLVLGSSLPSLTSGIRNVGVGQSALNATTSGFNNVALGWNTGLVLADGTNDVFVGFNSGKAVTSGQQNTYVGSISGQLTTTGTGNTGLGYGALQNLLTGSRNIVVGSGSVSGQNYNSTESDNIIIGNQGTTGESNTIRIGAQGASPGQQNLCFIAGITGVTTANTQMVTINSSTGQLGATATIALANGGTNASLVASNGGIFYSTATAGAILAGTATAGQMLRSGSNAAPSWSTATWPATIAVNSVLYASAANVITELTTTANRIFATGTGGVPIWSTQLAADYTFTSSGAGTARSLTVSNTDNTNSSSEARYVASVGGTSAGDAFSVYNIGSARSWSTGVDNSDSQNFKITTTAGANVSPSSGTTIQTITTAGNRTLPLNASSFAYRSAAATDVTGDGTAYVVIFDAERYDQNSNFDTTTGLFTAPVTGKYLVVANVGLAGLTASHTAGNILITAAGVSYRKFYNPANCRDSSNQMTMSFSTIVAVPATQTISITVTVSGGALVVDILDENFGDFTNVAITLLN